MKKTIYIKMIAALFVLGTMSSCNDLFNKQDIQVNPNYPGLPDADIDVLLSGAEVGVATSHEDTDTRIASYWAGTMAGQSRQQAGYQAYIVSAQTFDNSWYLIYHPAANARLIQEKAVAASNKVAQGIGQVLEAMQMAKIASLYGDVPYTQAFDLVQFPKPVFDKQTDIYPKLIALLGSAYTNLTTGTGTVNTDFYFGGDKTLWAAAAKTLQARLYLHLKDYANAKAAALLGISSTANDMLVPHGSAQTIDLNLNFDMFENSRPGDCGFDDAYLPKFMESSYVLVGGVQTPTYSRNAKTNDKALYNHYFKKAVYTSGLDPNTVDGAFTGDSPHPLLTYFETQLILAEASARTGDNAGALVALNNVRASLATGKIYGKSIKASYTTGGALQYDPYIITDFTPVTGIVVDKGSVTANLLYEIISQKYTVTLLQYEAFNDLRRLQVATAGAAVKLPIPLNSAASASITTYPARFIISQNEINTNPANIPKVNGVVADVFQKLPIFQ